MSDDQLISSVIKCSPKAEKKPASPTLAASERLKTKSQSKFEYFKSQLDQLNEKHKESMLILKEKSQMRSHRSRSHSRNASSDNRREGSTSKDRISLVQSSPADASLQLNSIQTVVQCKQAQQASFFREDFQTVQRRPKDSSRSPVRRRRSSSLRERNEASDSYLGSLGDRSTAPRGQDSNQLKMSDLKSSQPTIAQQLPVHLLTSEQTTLEAHPSSSGTQQIVAVSVLGSIEKEHPEQLPQDHPDQFSREEFDCESYQDKAALSTIHKVLNDSPTQATCNQETGHQSSSQQPLRQDEPRENYVSAFLDGQHDDDLPTIAERTGELGPISEEKSKQSSTQVDFKYLKIDQPQSQENKKVVGAAQDPGSPNEQPKATFVSNFGQHYQRSQQSSNTSSLQASVSAKFSLPSLSTSHLASSQHQPPASVPRGFRMSSGGDSLAVGADPEKYGTTEVIAPLSSQALSAGEGEVAESLPKGSFLTQLPDQSPQLMMASLLKPPPSNPSSTSQFIFSNPEAFLGPAPLGTNSNDEMLQRVKWEMRKEMYLDLKARFDSEIHDFMRQFRHDQMQILKREFESEFIAALQAEKKNIEENLSKENEELQERLKADYDQAKEAMKEEAHQAYQDQLASAKEDIRREHEEQAEVMRIECLKQVRDEKEDSVIQKLKPKLEKQIRLELEDKIRAEIEEQVLCSGEVEARIRAKLQVEFDKKEAISKRKHKLLLQEKEQDMQANFEKTFDAEVKTKAQALLEKRELDIQRKFRLQFQKQQAKVEQELKTKQEVEMAQLRGDLQKQIAELSRLRSVEHLRSKKANQNQKQMLNELAQKKEQLVNKEKMQSYLNRENQINIDLLMEKAEKQRLKEIAQMKSIKETAGGAADKEAGTTKDNSQPVKAGKTGKEPKERNLPRKPSKSPKRVRSENKFMPARPANTKASAPKKRSASRKKRPVENKDTSQSPQTLISIGSASPVPQSSERSPHRMAGLANDFGARQLFKNKQLSPEDLDIEKDLKQLEEEKIPGEDQELTLGRKPHEEPKKEQRPWEPTLLDSDYQNEFEQQFLLNKATFEKANKGVLVEEEMELPPEELPIEFEQDTLNFPIRVPTEEMLIQQHEGHHQEEVSPTPNFRLDLARVRQLELAQRQAEALANQKRVLLTTQDKEDLSESIRNLKYSPKRSSDRELKVEVKPASVKDEIMKHLHDQVLPKMHAEYGPIGESQILEQQDFPSSTEQTLGYDSRREYTSIDPAKLLVFPLRFQLKAPGVHHRSTSIGRSQASQFQTDDAAIFDERVKEFWKEDKHSEVIFRSKIKEIKADIQEFLENDHGLVDFVLEFFQKFNLAYQARLLYFANVHSYILNLGPQAHEQDTEMIEELRKKVQLHVYGKLQLEVERFTTYETQTRQIFSLLRKREEVSQFDQRFKANLSSQIMIKAEEFRRLAKRQQTSKKGVASLLVDDIYWRGVAYSDLCHSFKVLHEAKEKEQIRQELEMKRKAKKSRMPLPTGKLSRYEQHLEASKKKAMGAGYMTQAKRAVLIQGKQSDAGALSHRQFGGDHASNFGSFEEPRRLSSRRNSGLPPRKVAVQVDDTDRYGLYRTKDDESRPFPMGQSEEKFSREAFGERQLDEGELEFFKQQQELEHQSIGQSSAYVQALEHATRRQ